MKSLKDIYTVLDQLIEITILTYELHNKDLNKTKEWLNTKNPIYFNETPLNYIMSGRGNSVLEKQKELLRI